MRRKWIRISGFRATCPYCLEDCVFDISLNHYKKMTAQTDALSVCKHYVGKSRKYSGGAEYAIFG